jgi:hypothetical protein
VRHGSAVVGSVFLLAAGVVGLAACGSDPSTGGADAKPVVTQKNAGIYGDVQLTVLNETTESVPVRICYDALNVESSCATYYPTQTVSATVLYGEAEGVVGPMPTGVAFVARNPSIGDPHFMLASAANATAESFQRGGDVAVDLPFIDSSPIWMDAGEVQHRTVNGYALRLERRGDENGDKVMRVIIESTPTTTPS